MTDTKLDLRRSLFLVVVGLFVTTLGQPGVIGQLPFLFLLKNEFHMNAAQQANFFAVATFAWYLKPLAGLLCDSFPLFGTRRRSYLMLGAGAAGIVWALFAFVPHTYSTFFWLMVALNAAMVIVSTSIGGVLVETGQKYNSTGHLAAARYGIDGIISIIVGPLGGWLAAQAFGLTAGIGAFLLLTFVPIVAIFVKEEQREKDLNVWHNAAVQLSSIVKSRTMWAGAGLLFLVFIAPGFGIALKYYQQDVLKFDTQFIGRLQAYAGIGGIIATGLYALFCKRLSLKTLLLCGIFVNAASSMLYLWYRSPESAVVIDTMSGFLCIFGVLPLFDLAARATPKGSEGFGYALLMSVYNVAVFAVSNPIGSWLYERSGSWHHNMSRLIMLNTGTSLVALLFIPFLPLTLIVKNCDVNDRYNL